MPAKKMITPAMVGTWLDGSMGWHNAYRVMDVARAWGWRPEYGRSVRQAQKLYERNDPDATCKYNKGDTLTYDEACEWINGQRGLSDEATEHLQSRCPDGYGFVWDAGELSLVPICEHDNCEYGACSQD